MNIYGLARSLLWHAYINTFIYVHTSKEQRTRYMHTYVHMKEHFDPIHIDTHIHIHTYAPACI